MTDLLSRAEQSGGDYRGQDPEFVEQSFEFGIPIEFQPKPADFRPRPQLDSAEIPGQWSFLREKYKCVRSVGSTAVIDVKRVYITDPDGFPRI